MYDVLGRLQSRIQRGWRRIVAIADGRRRSIGDRTGWVETGTVGKANLGGINALHAVISGKGRIEIGGIIQSQIGFDGPTLSIGVNFSVGDRGVTGLTTLKGTKDPNVHGAVVVVVRGVIGGYHGPQPQYHHHHHCSDRHHPPTTTGRNCCGMSSV